MNPLMILKGLKTFLILGVIAAGLMMANSWMEDQRNLRDTLITTSAEKISAQARSQELENANLVLASNLTMVLESRAASRVAVEALNQTFAEAEVQAQKERAVLENASRLQRLANERADTIIRLSNAATQEVFDELENLFNDTG